jgi:hypothetical protein
MSIRYWRRIRLAPGLRLNLSRGDVSASLGHRGLWYTVSRGGRRRVTVGLPGTGLFFTRVSRVSPSLPVIPLRRILHWLLVMMVIYIVLALLAIGIVGLLSMRR